MTCCCNNFKHTKSNVLRVTLELKKSFCTAKIPLLATVKFHKTIKSMVEQPKKKMLYKDFPSKHWYIGMVQFNCQRVSDVSESYFLYQYCMELIQL